MISRDVQGGGSLETPAEGAVVPSMIVENRSRFGTAAQYVDSAGDGTSRLVNLLGAIGRFPGKVIATGAGEVVRGVRESAEAYRNTVDGGEPQPTDQN